MLSDLVRKLLGLDGGAARPATQAAKKAGSAAARGIGGAGKMNPMDSKMGRAMRMPAPNFAQLQPKQPMQPNIRVREGRPDFMGELPIYRVGDGALGRGNGLKAYNTEEARNMELEPDLRLDRALGARTVNPMDFETIPNNYTDNRTGYYQGSNPGLNSLEELRRKLRVY